MVGLPALSEIRESRQTPAMETVFPTSRGMPKIQLHNKSSVILEKYSNSLGQRQMHHFHLLISVIRPRNIEIAIRIAEYPSR